MAGLPIMFLLLTAILLWLMRRSHIRVLWMVTLAGVFASWLSTLILTYALPLQFVFLRGQTDTPNTLLRLDLTSWPFVLILSTLFLSSVLSTFTNRIEFAWKFAFQFMVVGAAGLAAAMAGNVLSFVLSWSVLDLTILAIGLNNARDESERRQAMQKLGFRASATILLMVAELLNRNSGGTEDLRDIRAFAVFGCLFIVLLLRSGKFGKDVRLGKRQPLALSMQAILSRVAAFSLLARVLTSSFHISIIAELRIAGVAFAGWAIAALLINGQLRKKRVDPGLIFLGVVLPMQAQSLHLPEPIAVNMGVLLILLAWASQNLQMSRTWHMVIIGTLALMIVGMPGSFGSALTGMATRIIQSQNLVGFWLLAPLVLILFGSRIIMQGLDTIKEFGSQAAGPSVRATIAMLLLPFSGFATLMVDRPITVAGGSFFIAMAGAMIISVIALRRLKIIPRANHYSDWISRSFRPLIRGMFLLFRQVVHGSAVLFEGETGMLWVYVILLFLFVAFGILS